MHKFLLLTHITYNAYQSFSHLYHLYVFSLPWEARNCYTVFLIKRSVTVVGVSFLSSHYYVYTQNLSVWNGNYFFLNCWYSNSMGLLHVWNRNFNLQLLYSLMKISFIELYNYYIKGFYYSLTKSSVFSS